MATDPRAALPKRFRPYLDQSVTQAELRYGGQEAALGTVLAQLVNDYSRQSQAQSSAGQTVLGALRGADTQLEQVYSDAGLTPQLRQQIAGSPTGQRLAGELASGRAGIQQQLLGAQQGQQYIQQRLGEQYQDDVGQVSSQNTALAKERGLYTSSLLDELIGNDRAGRSAANAAARKQAADDQQQALDRATSTGNALIGQGITPQIGADGSVTLGDPLPGGKADPESKENKARVKWLDQGGQNSAQAAISKALAQAKRLKREGRERSEAAVSLTEGRPGQQVTDSKGNKINIPGVPSFEEIYASVALDMAYDGHISRRNVDELHKKRIKVKPLGYSTKGEPKPKDKKPTPSGVFDGLNSPSVG